MGGGGGGKIEGRHILIIAMSEHYVDYMNRKGGHSVIMQGGSFHRCVHQIAWTREWRQGSGKLLISIAEVRKRYYSEIESCKSKPIDQKFQLFCVATRHSR